ncbi:MAG TPA: hypothetical protein VGM97_10045, partial [Steroidobacteraceae bacterium]
KKLERIGFAELDQDSYYNNEPFDVVKITDEGWEWLESNQDKLAMKWGPAKSKIRVEEYDGPPVDVPAPKDDVPF